MNTEPPRPAWLPRVSPSHSWTVEHLRRYLGGKPFTLYTHGTCVVWGSANELTPVESNQRLRAVTAGHPDFKVRRHPDGNYLVTFKGGVGGLMSGELLTANLTSLQEEASTLGMLPTERLSIDRHDDGEALDMIAGLYVRAQLYRDAKELAISAVVR